MKRDQSKTLRTTTILVVIASVVTLSVGCAASPAAVPAPVEEAASVEEAAPVEAPAPAPKEEPAAAPGASADYCDPDNPALQSLAEFPIREEDSELVDASSLVVYYKNEFGQEFRVAVDSQNTDVAYEFINTAKICLVAAERTALPPEGSASSSRGALLEALETSLGYPEWLEKFSTMIMAGEITSLAEFLEMNGIDPDEVIEMAKGIAQRRLDEAGLDYGDFRDYAAVVYGEIPLEEYMGWDDQVGDDLGQDLRDNPQDLAINMAWINPTGEPGSYRVYFMIDPCVGQYRRHWYWWQSLGYVETRIRVTGGRASHGLWRWDGWSNSIDYDTANNGFFTDWLWENPVGEFWYKAHVYGRNEGNNCWWIQGSWE